jgi:hypothetical protein
MNCPKCGTINSDQQKYCGECGASLQAASGLSGADLQQQIRAVLKQEFQDQKLVEIEVTEAIVTRITNWTRLLGYFAGIPLAILILILGALGIKNYTDVSATATAAEQKIGALSDNASKQAALIENASRDGTKLVKQTEELKAQLADVEPKIAAIRANADAIEANTRELQKLRGVVNDIQKAVTKPGVERWRVKTGDDPDAALVGLPQNATKTTVEDLAMLARPQDMPATASPPQYENKRARPVETTVYSVEADIVALKLEADGDYHMVLQGSGGATLVAEIPDPDPTFTSPSSRWAKEIAAARRKVDEKLLPQAGVTRLHMRARVVGVGFFDRVRGQLGVAHNGIELHPVIGIEFLQ